MAKTVNDRCPSCGSLRIVTIVVGPGTTELVCLRCGHRFGRRSYSTATRPQALRPAPGGPHPAGSNGATINK
jgi:hypothetical protein